MILNIKEIFGDLFVIVWSLTLTSVWPWPFDSDLGWGEGGGDQGEEAPRRAVGLDGVPAGLQATDAVVMLTQGWGRFGLKTIKQSQNHK